MDEEEVLTTQEEEKINYLRESNKNKMLAKATASMVSAYMTPATIVGGALSLEPVRFTFERRLGLNPVVTITNISGKNAWVILAPAPIASVGGIGIDNIANISLSTSGEYKCQQFLLRNNKSDEYDLDTSQLYYTVFFECDGTWKTPFKNRKINTIYGSHVSNTINGNNNLNTT
jgi:hypothetical protein